MDSAPQRNTYIFFSQFCDNCKIPSVFSGIISFCVCYYRGPVTSDRGLDLIRWMLQLIGLTLLYMGTRSEVVSFGVISTVFLSHVIRNSGILMGVIRMMPRNW